MAPLLVLLGLVGVAGAAVAVAGTSSAPDPRKRIKIDLLPTAPIDDLEAQFRANAARSQAQRDKQEADARAEVNANYDKIASIPIVGYYFAALGPFAKAFYSWGIDAGKAFNSWITSDPDWNSEEEQARVRALLVALSKQGLAPPTPMPDDQFKNYGDELQHDVDALQELWTAHPENRALWLKLQDWLRTHPSDPRVVDVLAIRDARGRPAWPARGVGGFGGYSRLEGGKRVVRVGESALALATLIAAMRGADPVRARAAVREFQEVLVPRENPALTFSDHTQWMMGGVLDAADYATRTPGALAGYALAGMNVRA